jgi:hypothetical protein
LKNLRSDAGNHGGVSCDICNDIVVVVEGLVLKGWAFDEITAYVDQYCATLAYPLNTICTAIADASVAEIINLVVEGLNALQICTKLGFC